MYSSSSCSVAGAAGYGDAEYDDIVQDQRDEVGGGGGGVQPVDRSGGPGGLPGGPGLRPAQLPLLLQVCKLIFSCGQAAQLVVMLVRPSVRPSVT